MRTLTFCFITRVCLYCKVFKFDIQWFFSFQGTPSLVIFVLSSDFLTLSDFEFDRTLDDKAEPHFLRLFLSTRNCSLPPPQRGSRLENRGCYRDHYRFPPPSFFPSPPPFSFALPPSLTWFRGRSGSDDDGSGKI